MYHETVAQELVAFGIEHFIETMNLLVQEPNIISPAILRAEVLQDVGGEKRRVLQRVLVPRQSRDSLVWQQVVYEYANGTAETGSCTVTHRCFKDKTFGELATVAELPYFYPKVDSFSYHYKPIPVPAETSSSTNLERDVVEKGCFSITVACKDKESMQQLLDERTKHIFTKVCKKVLKICVGTMNGYKKRVYHDVVIEKILYQNRYRILKEKYSDWVAKWPEETDPSKHVFEDIGIATWLILLFEQKPQSPGKSKRFVDLGCGNGFLTYILLNEGFSGIGLDLSRRRLWSMFPEDVIQGRLIERPILPKQEDFSEFEFIIGNHSDELTPWVPVIARRDSCKWMIIPCCLFELCGRKFTKCIPELGRYKTYCQYLIDFSRNTLGYCGSQSTEVEHLRIPSTKNVCIVMRQEAADEDEADADSKKALAQKIIDETDFVPRKPDRLKQQELRDKKMARMQKKSEFILED
jgi:hypothetical protein